MANLKQQSNRVLNLTEKLSAGPNKFDINSMREFN